MRGRDPYARNLATLSGLGFVRPEQYGASPNTTPTQNTNAIQQALNIGGHVYLGTPGTFQINGPLNISSNTIFELGPNTIIQLAPQSNCVMIQNTHYNNTSNPDSYIWLRGGIWDGNRTNQTRQDNPEGTGTPLVTWFGIVLQFVNVSNFKLEKTTLRNPTSYGFYGGNIHYFTVEDIYFDYGASPPTNTDGIHLQYADHGTVKKLRGLTGDDMVALNATDEQVCNIAPGPIYSIDIEDLQGEGVYRFVRLLSGASNAIHDISIKGIYGTATHAAVLFSGLNGSPSFYDILIEDIKMTSSQTLEPVVYIDSNGLQNLTIANLTRNQPQYHTTDTYLETIMLASGYSVNELIVSNMNVQDNTTYSYTDIHIQGTVTTLSVTNSTRNYFGTATPPIGNWLVVDGGGTVTNLNVSNVNVGSTVTAIECSGSTSTISNILIDGFRTTNVEYPIENVGGNIVNILIGSGHLINYTNGIYFNGTTSTACRIKANSLRLQSTVSGALALATSGTVPMSLMTMDFQVDVGTLTPQTGDVTNNNRASTTAGPAYYNGAHWISMVDGSTVY